MGLRWRYHSRGRNQTGTSTSPQQQPANRKWVWYLISLFGICTHYFTDFEPSQSNRLRESRRSPWKTTWPCTSRIQESLMIVRCALKILSLGITVWHHDACSDRQASWCQTVIRNDGIFNLHLQTIMDSFSCKLFLLQLHSCLYLCYVIKITLKKLHFLIKRCSVQFLSKITSKHLAENDIIMTPKVMSTR